MAETTEQARWYCVDREGVAMSCIDEADARANAEEWAAVYPHRAPYRAMRLGDVTALLDDRDALAAKLAQARCLVRDLLPIAESDEPALCTKDQEVIARARAALAQEPAPSAAAAEAMGDAVGSAARVLMFEVRRLAEDVAALRKRAEETEADNRELRVALRFYARAEHYSTDEADEFDTVSGEPDNWLSSGREDSGTMIEDGSIARQALRGQPINWMDGDEDTTPQPIEGERAAI